MSERLDTEEGRWLAVLRGRRAAGAYAVATLEDVERLLAAQDELRAANDRLDRTNQDLLTQIANARPDPLRYERDTAIARAEQAGAREIQCLKDLEAVGDALGWMAGEYVHKSLPGAVTELKARAERAEALAAEERERGHEALRKGMTAAQKKHGAMRAAEAALAALREAADEMTTAFTSWRECDTRHVRTALRRMHDTQEALLTAIADTAQAAEAYTRRVRAEGVRAGVEAAVEHWRIDSATGDEIDAVCARADAMRGGR